MEPFGIELEIAGRVYAGHATWTEELGLDLDLRTPLEGGPINTPPSLPRMLPAVINGFRRAVLVNPAFDSFGGFEWKADEPSYGTCTMRADGFLPDASFDQQTEPRVVAIRFASNSLSLWYGETGRKVEWVDGGVTAKFDWNTVAYDCSRWTLVIHQTIQAPPMRPLGKYHFDVRPKATIALRQSLTIAEALDEARRLEGLFDLLATFPRRTLEIELLIAGSKSFLPLRSALSQRPHYVRDHDFNVFINRTQGIGLARIASVYCERHGDLLLMQLVLRILSSTTLNVPDGFLTACNVLESLGRPPQMRTSY